MIGCATEGCDATFTRGHWECRCGCGKRWCEHHGQRRKRMEMPGQKSYLEWVAATEPGKDGSHG